MQLAVPIPNNRFPFEAKRGRSTSVAPQQMSRIVAEVDESYVLPVAKARQGEVQTLRQERQKQEKEGDVVPSSLINIHEQELEQHHAIANLEMQAHPKRDRKQPKERQVWKWHTYLKSKQATRGNYQNVFSVRSCRGEDQARNIDVDVVMTDLSLIGDLGKEVHDTRQENQQVEHELQLRSREEVDARNKTMAGQKSSASSTYQQVHRLEQNRLESQSACGTEGSNPALQQGESRNVSARNSYSSERFPLLESSFKTKIKDSVAGGQNILRAPVPKVIDGSYWMGKRGTFKNKTRISVNKPRSLVSFIGLGLVGLFACLCCSVHGMDSLSLTPTCFLPPNKKLSNPTVYVHRRLHVEHPRIHEDDSPKISQGKRRQLVRWSIAIIPSLLLTPAAFALLPDEAGRSYDAYAKNYDVLDGGQAANILGIDEARSSLFGQAQGNVLEIGAGTGLNLDKYDTSKISSITLVDISDGMLQESKKRLESLDTFNSIPVKFVRADATSELVQKFEAKSFDT